MKIYVQCDRCGMEGRPRESDSKDKEAFLRELSGLPPKLLPPSDWKET